MRRAVTVVLGLVTSVWILYTMLQVARFGGAALLDPEATGRIMGVRNDGQVSSAIGLTYVGTPGGVLAVAQIVIVLAALVAGWSRRLAARRAGLIVLLVWTGVWLGNSIWMEQLTGGRHPSRTIAVAAALAVAVAWAWRRWPRGQTRPSA